MEYPTQWQRSVATRDGVAYRIRPICAEDEQLDREFILRLSPDSRYRRMMNAMRELPPELSYQFVHVDYDRDMAFAAVTGRPSHEAIIGVARYNHDLAGTGYEFAIAVADEWQKRGVGTTLMQALLEYAHARGIREVHGSMLADNHRMIELARSLGMTLRHPADGAGLIEATRQT